jgi:hypothetical protein
MVGDFSGGPTPMGDLGAPAAFAANAYTTPNMGLGNFAAANAAMVSPGLAVPGLAGNTNGWTPSFPGGNGHGADMGSNRGDGPFFSPGLFATSPTQVGMPGHGAFSAPMYQSSAATGHPSASLGGNFVQSPAGVPAAGLSVAGVPAGIHEMNARAQRGTGRGMLSVGAVMASGSPVQRRGIRNYHGAGINRRGAAQTAPYTSMRVRTMANSGGENAVEDAGTAGYGMSAAPVANMVSALFRFSVEQRLPACLSTPSAGLSFCPGRSSPLPPRHGSLLLDMWS